MPIKKCNGGYKYGDSGKCYKGSSGKSKAARQGRAIEASKAKREKK